MKLLKDFRCFHSEPVHGRLKVLHPDTCLTVMQDRGGWSQYCQTAWKLAPPVPWSETPTRAGCSAKDGIGLDHGIDWLLQQIATK